MLFSFSCRIFFSNFSHLTMRSCLKIHNSSRSYHSNYILDDYYAVAASDDPSNNKSKAILMSEVIQCSEGTSKFSMMYWVSPFVEITFCIKTIKKSYPNFDFCSVLPTKNSPGPVNIVIPPMGEDTFQVCFVIFISFLYFLFRYLL